MALASAIRLPDIDSYVTVIGLRNASNFKTFIFEARRLLERHGSVGIVTTDVSEERIASIFGVERIRALGINLAEASNIILSALKMEATHSSVTSVLTITTGRHISQDGIPS
jgi:hypothetical protein